MWPPVDVNVKLTTWFVVAPAAVAFGDLLVVQVVEDARRGIPEHGHLLALDLRPPCEAKECTRNVYTR